MRLAGDRNDGRPARSDDVQLQLELRLRRDGRPEQRRLRHAVQCAGERPARAQARHSVIQSLALADSATLDSRDPLDLNPLSVHASIVEKPYGLLRLCQGDLIATLRA